MPEVCELSVDTSQEFRLLELFRRNVDRHRQRHFSGKLVLPFLQLAATLLHTPPPEGNDQARLFGNGDKFVWKDPPANNFIDELVAAIGIVPAHECLETRDVTALERNDWLIMKDQLISFHSHLEARFQMDPGEGPGM